MDDLTSTPAPPYPRVAPTQCPICERRVDRLEHVIHADVVTSNWICQCGATWSADRDLEPERPKDERQTSTDAVVLGDLRDLVAALDRRQPHVDDEREHRVATLSAALREQAVERIVRLEGGSTDSPDCLMVAAVRKSGTS